MEVVAGSGVENWERGGIVRLSGRALRELRVRNHPHYYSAIVLDYSIPVYNGA